MRHANAGTVCCPRHLGRNQTGLRPTTTAPPLRVSVEFPGSLHQDLGQLRNVTVTEVRDGVVLAQQSESLT